MLYIYKLRYIEEDTHECKTECGIMHARSTFYLIEKLERYYGKEFIIAFDYISVIENDFGVLTFNEELFNVIIDYDIEKNKNMH